MKSKSYIAAAAILEEVEKLCNAREEKHEAARWVERMAK